jgi:hypothetical protein
MTAGPTVVAAAVIVVAAVRPISTIDIGGRILSTVGIGKRQRTTDTGDEQARYH